MIINCVDMMSVCILNLFFFLALSLYPFLSHFSCLICDFSRTFAIVQFHLIRNISFVCVPSHKVYCLKQHFSKRNDKKTPVLKATKQSVFGIVDERSIDFNLNEPDTFDCASLQ